MQSTIEKLNSNIAKGESRLERKIAVAQNKTTRRNLRAKQKALNRTKKYFKLMSQYITAEKNTVNIQAIRKERANKKQTIKNITLTTGNKRANNLGESMKKLFNNTPTTKESTRVTNITTPVLKPETPVEPLVPKINITAKNTKRKEIAQVMKDKNPYELLGLDPKTVKAEDFNSTVKDTFNKLLRAKKPKNISNNNHDKKLAQLRQARDFLLNSTLRTEFNSRVQTKINPNTLVRRNTSQLLAEQRQQPEPVPARATLVDSEPLPVRSSFSSQTVSSASANSSTRNASSALLFG